MPQKIPLQGRLYITPRFLCFAPLPIASSIGATKIVVPFSDIAEIKKGEYKLIKRIASVIRCEARSAWGLMANSLVLTLVDGHRVFFTSFFNRDKCYKRIVELSKDKENLARQDRTSSEPIALSNGLAPKNAVSDSTNDSEEQQQEDEPWRCFDPRKQNSKSGELGASGFLQLSGSSTQLADIDNDLDDDGQVRRCCICVISQRLRP